MKQFIIYSATCLVALTLLLSSCKKDTKYDIALKETTLGKVLVDKNGKTLYFFAKDVDGQSKCTGACLENWPPFTDAFTTLDPALEKQFFNTINTTDGKKQVTYKGWPLYYYKNDANPGDVKGDNAGNVWFVAKHNYSIMIASAQLKGKDDKNYILQDTSTNSNKEYKYVEGTGETIYLTNPNGATIYAFVRDTYNKNSYTNSEFSNDAIWPIWTTTINELPTGLNKSSFAEITVHGRKQITFKGWPVYFYGDDKMRGETKGVSVPTPGIWPIFNLDTKEATGKSEATSSTTTTTSTRY